MERFRSFARLLAVNIGVVVGLLVVTNLASGLAIAASDALAGNSGDAGDPRASLPNYSDRARAELMFQELHRLKAVYAPFEEWTLEPFAGQTTTVDVHGNRVQPNAPTLPNDATVVHFFGGSTMFGTGSEDGETIPAQFAKLNAGIRVKNHGRSGFDTRQSLEQLISLLNLDERLDVAVFYLGVNDVASLCRRDTSVNGHEQEARMRELLDAPSSESGWANALYRPLLSNTAVLAGKVARAIKRATTSPASTPVYRCADDPDHARAVADTVERNLLACNRWPILVARRSTISRET
jgi:lysophospholipase L1-like esterase